MDPRAQRIAALVAEAEALEAQAEAAFTARDATAAVEAYEEALVRREAAKLLEARGSTGREHKSSVNGMLAVHKVAISKGRSSDQLAHAARKAGMSMRGLATKLGVSPALLSMARGGDRSIKRGIAERVEKLTGFAATAANWPGGIVD